MRTVLRMGPDSFRIVEGDWADHPDYQHTGGCDKPHWVCRGGTLADCRAWVEAYRRWRRRPGSCIAALLPGHEGNSISACRLDFGEGPPEPEGVEASMLSACL